MFADDLILISISVTDLQKMLNVCSNVFSKLDLPINERKCECMRIGPRYKTKCNLLQISNVKIDWVDSIKYLGINICSAKKLKFSWTNAKGKFFRSANIIFGRLGTKSSIDVILKLINTNAVSALLYGTAAITMNKSDLSDMTRAYDSTFAKLFKTSVTSIIRKCQYFCGYWPISMVYDYNRYNF